MNETKENVDILKLIKELEQKIFEEHKGEFETLASYIKDNKYNLDYEKLYYISYRFYGSHEYSKYYADNQEYIDKLCFEDKFKLFKSLYCSSKEGNPLISELLQDLSEDYGVPKEEVRLIKDNFSNIVYRGINQYNNDNGYSYTKDYEMAKWFAKRFNSSKQLIKTITIDIDDVVFFNFKDVGNFPTSF